MVVIEFGTTNDKRKQYYVKSTRFKGTTCIGKLTACLDYDSCQYWFILIFK